MLLVGTYSPFAEVPKVYAEEIKFIETIEEKIVRIAEIHGIANTSLYSLVESESNFDPNAVSKTGDRGLVQINKKAWPGITDAQAFDPEFSLNFAAEKIANGEGSIWVAGNCYQFAKVLVGKLPRMAEIVPNTPHPRVGGLAIFQYKSKHIGVVTKISEDGFEIREANYVPYKIGKRFIKWGDPKLVGFASYKN